MPCYSPLKGWLSNEVNPSGKRSIVFRKSEALFNAEVSIPCGQCIGCRLERSRQWAVRCVHEASLYERNCFITLTFDDSFLNEKGSLVKADFQKFMKRLRKKFSSDKIRYFHCGEYGAKGMRPHHHACLFNFDFDDKVFWSKRDNVCLYRSEILENLWPFGFCTIGDVTFDSAAYVARYILKKVLGKEAKEFYGDKVPEYTTMSRRPGIGRDWFEKFKSDVYPQDLVVLRGGVRCRPPKYYDKIFDLTNPKEFAILKTKRSLKAFNNENNSPRRLLVRGACKLIKAKLLKRGVEQDEASNLCYTR